MTSSTFKIIEHILEGQHIREYAQATAFKQEDTLRIAIKQYIPLDNLDPQPGDVTIIGAHANGYPKELYEPLWIDLHARSKTNGFRIRGIWIADVAQQGASLVLNEHLIGLDNSWYDHVRDLLHMINHFRTEMSLPIIGIGHSMGANHLVNLALFHPRLFSTLILMEPVISGIFSKPGDGNIGRIPARLSTFRRDIWPSRAAAAASFRKQKYYQTWDSRVLDLWIEHGLRPTPTALYPDERDGTVTLTTTTHQEVRTFLRPMYARHPDRVYDAPQRELYPDVDPALHPNIMPFYRTEVSTTFTRLRELRPSVLYIFGGQSDMSSPDARALKMAQTGVATGGSGGVAEGRVKELTFEDKGHLVPYEVVGECAGAIAAWTAEELKLWRRKQTEYEEWTRLPLRERQEVDDEWRTKIGGPFQKPPATKPKL